MMSGGGSSNSKQTAMTEQQKKGLLYLKDNRIEEILLDLISTMAHKRHDQPLVYMIKLLAKQVPSDVLKANGIYIDNTEEVELISQISYPNFSSDCGNLFKHALSTEVYQQCKPKRTAYSNDLRHLIDLALENQKHKVGLFSCDAECAVVFQPLYRSVEQALFGSIYPLPESFRYNYSANLPSTTSIKLELKFLEDFTIKIKRNLRDCAFNSALKSTERAQINARLSEAIIHNLGKFFPFQFNLSDLESEDRTNLAVQFNKLIRESAVLTKTGIRYREWPNDRFIAISQNKRFMLWVNKEDHLELKCSASREHNFVDHLAQSVFIIQLLEEALAETEIHSKSTQQATHNTSQSPCFSFTSQAGFSTVKPAHSGLGMKFKLKVKIPSSQVSVFKRNIESFRSSAELKDHFEVKQLKKDSSRWTIALNKTYGIPSLMNLLNLSEKLFKCLFQSIIDSSGGMDVPISLAELNQYQKSIELQEMSSMHQSNQPAAAVSASQLASKDNQLDQGKHFQTNTAVAAADQLMKPDHIEITIEEDSNDSSTSPQNESTQAGESLNPNNEGHEHQQPRAASVEQWLVLMQQQQEQKGTNKNKTSSQLKVFDIEGIAKQCTEPSVVLLNGGEFIKRASIVIKRNYESLPLKTKMNQSDYDKCEGFSRALMTLMQHEWGGELLSCRDQNYEGTVEEFLESVMVCKNEFTKNQVSKTSLKNTHNTNSAMKSSINPELFPLGTLFYHSKEVSILSGLNDHLLVAVSIEQDDILESLMLANWIINQTTEKFICNQSFGYLTRDIDICGAGLEIVYELKQLSSSSTTNAPNSSTQAPNELSSQIEEDSSITQKLSANKESLYLKLQYVTPDTLHAFSQRCNYHLLSIKLRQQTDNQLITENQLCQLDCFDNNGKIIAPERECYTYYKNLYERYISSFNIREACLGVNYMPTNLKLNDIAKDVKITFQFRRNFDAYNFNKYMTFNDVSKLKAHTQRIFSKLPHFYKNNEEKENDSSNTSIIASIAGNTSTTTTSQQPSQSKNTPPSSYKTSTYTHTNKYFFVDVMKTDHISVFSFGQLKEFPKSILETFELFSKLQTDKHVFLRDDKLGYLSEQGQRLGDNLYLKVELSVNGEELQHVKRIAKQFQYHLAEEKPQQSAAKKNQSKSSGSSSLSYSSSSSSSSSSSLSPVSTSSSVVLELKRCGYFSYELEMLKSLIFALTEKKNQQPPQK